MLSDEEQAAFLDSIERVRLSAVNHLSSNRSTSFVVNFVANLHNAVDKSAQQANDRGPKSDCKIGCAYCCTVRVEATEPEIFHIAREIKKLPSYQINNLLDRLRHFVAKAKTDDSCSHRTICAFLDENLCSIYAVRPAVCRKAHSLSAAHCKDLAPEIPQNLALLVEAEALMRGTSDAYRKINLYASAHELCNAILLALTDETAEARWFNGEPVFPDDGTQTI